MKAHHRQQADTVSAYLPVGRAASVGGVRMFLAPGASRAVRSDTGFVQQGQRTLESRPVALRLRALRARQPKGAQANPGTGDEPLRRTSANLKDNLVGYFHALVFYEQGKFAEGLEAMDRNRKSREINGDCVRALLLAELPDAQLHLQQAFQEYTNQYRTASTWAPIFPLLLGATAESRAESLELVQQTNRLPRLRREFYLRLVQYQAGVLPEAAFLNSLGTSRWNQCEGQFFVALTHLAEGDRANTYAWPSPAMPADSRSTIGVQPFLNAWKPIPSGPPGSKKTSAARCYGRGRVKIAPFLLGL